MNPISEFARDIHAIFDARKPTRIIETGTYLAQGTTAIIGSAITKAAIQNAEFYSIEVNPQRFAQAIENVKRQRIPVHLMLGLSIPRAMLPSRQQIAEHYIRHIPPGIYVDWVDGDEQSKIDRYERETNFQEVPEDLLGKVLARFDHKPNFLLLDSAGHLGYVEFRYVVGKLQAPCVLALDDTRHLKHFRTVMEIKADPRFKMMKESDEKFGFCIAEFNP